MSQPNKLLLWIHSLPLLAPAKPQLCFHCHIKNREKTLDICLTQAYDGMIMCNSMNVAKLKKQQKSLQQEKPLCILQLAFYLAY